jgi:hypothetical protein
MRVVHLALISSIALGCGADPALSTGNAPDSSLGGAGNAPDAATGGVSNDASAGSGNLQDAGPLIDSGHLPDADSGEVTDSGNDAGSLWNPGSVLQDADQIAIAKLMDPDAGAPADAGPPFHGIPLATEFVVASETVESELLQLLSAPQTYMSAANGCFAEQVGVRIRTPEGDVDLIVGLDCWNAHFYLPDGTRRSRYFTPATIDQFAALAHDVVPAIDVVQ